MSLQISRAGKVFIFGVAAIALVGCANMSPEAQRVVGAITGGAAGFFVGKAVCGDRDEAACAAIGTVVGGLIGNEIAARLTEKDRQIILSETEQALETGQTRSFRNPDTGLTGTIDIKPSEPLARAEQVPVVQAVEVVPPLESVSGTFVATSNVNVRSGPSTDFQRIETLRQGDKVRVVGRVKGTEWNLISRGQAGEGYVSARFLREDDGTFVASAQPIGGIKSVSTTVDVECRSTSTQLSVGGESKTSAPQRVCRLPNAQQNQQWQPIS